MTISRGAKASATKKNNIARKSLPLFGDGLLRDMGELTTPEQEQVRLNRAHAIAKVYLEQIQQYRDESVRTLPIVEAWAISLLPQNIYSRKKRVTEVCPSGYGWDIYPSAIADHLGLTRRETWETFRRFCGLEPS